MRSISLLVMVVMLAGWAGAVEGPPFALDVQVVRAAAGHVAGAHVYDAGVWTHRVRAGELQVLESGTITGTLRSDSLLHVGSKVPIPYVDPRTGGYQVQYVDSGLKLDVKVSQASPGMLLVECRVERNSLQEGDAIMPTQDGVVVNSCALLAPGQVAVIASTRGKYTRQYLKHAFPHLTVADNDTLLVAIRPHKE